MALDPSGRWRRPWLHLGLAAGVAGLAVFLADRVDAVREAAARSH